MDVATGMNANRRLLDDMPDPAVGVMRMSADQADVQHELADQRMEEIDRSVLDTP